MLPPTVLSNDDLAAMVDTSDEWISTRTGIKRRHIANGVTALELASGAAERALEQAAADPESVGLVVCATILPDKIVPSLAAEVRHALGIQNAVAFDINSACTGFVAALITAAGVMEAVGVERALVVGCEILSRITDWTDRKTCVLFADGAGAVLLSREGGPGFLAQSLMGTSENMYALSCFANWPEGRYAEAPPSPLITMGGDNVYRFAVTEMCAQMELCASRAGIALGEIDHIVPHQANERILRSVAHKCGLPIERFALNIAEAGNTSAASIPIALDELNRAGALKRGDTVMLVGAGGGLSAGAVLLRW